MSEATGKPHQMKFVVPGEKSKSSGVSGQDSYRYRKKNLCRRRQRESPFARRSKNGRYRGECSIDKEGGTAGGVGYDRGGRKRIPNGMARQSKPRELRWGQAELPG